MGIKLILLATCVVAFIVLLITIIFVPNIIAGKNTVEALNVDQEYFIIECFTLNGCVLTVNKYMQLGWKPQGGIMYANYWYFQAMVKK